MGLARNPFGKDVANLQLWRAVAQHGGYERVDVLSLRPTSTKALAEALFEGQGPRPELSWAMLPGSRAARDAGVLLRGQPYLADLAWLRRREKADRAYSLVGWIHTLAPPAIRQFIADTAVAPTQPWDALVCTSPAVRENVEAMLGGWGEHLAERTGGRPPPHPMLPIIPLGVDGPALAARADRPEARARVRAEFGLAEADVLVLWVGRLSYFEKAFPQPMFKAVAQARAQSAANRGPKVAFALAGWFPQAADRERFEAAARAHAPGVDVRFLDGNDAAAVGDLWAGADIFLSLVDNIQETFGITPLEAMAAGLPVVASDWDGYRATVRHGVEGFLIPTLLGGGGGGLGAGLVERHLLELVTYQALAGAVAQHTAVHIGRCAEALAELIASPDLRRRMGQAGRARVAQTYDWPVVARQVRALTDELAAMRSVAVDPPRRTVADPVRSDPFRTFAAFATEPLTLDTWLSAVPGVTAEDIGAAADAPLDGAFAGLRSGPDLCAQALALIAEAGRIQVRDVLLAFPVAERRALELGLAWMAKYGFVDWLA
ncbi:glycosyltransferase family 4 protein [uncultured Phenylobacterium sp.]|uniref:glycosyltransferase family 4 protein n=1 Tax=uncultured Phenylobacterium sp. TaxID=349273 RepID=UPI0025DDAAFE|nr:glycosyltransferase family 4 protein [uncultured Phenylobacterium sp.]